MEIVLFKYISLRGQEVPACDDMTANEDPAKLVKMKE
jgi:hypothetical protein